MCTVVHVVVGVCPLEEEKIVVFPPMYLEHCLLQSVHVSVYCAMITNAPPPPTVCTCTATKLGARFNLLGGYPKYVEKCTRTLPLSLSLSLF